MQESIAQSFSANRDFARDDDDTDFVREALLHPSAFGVLYERYYNTVYRYLLVCTGNVEDAADLTQQVFLQTLAALHSYRPHKGTFSAWLLRIAHNSAINFLKRNRTPRAWNLTDETLATTVSEFDLETEVLHREALQRLHTLLANLDPFKRELLTLRFVSGLTTAEIAVVIGKTRTATKKQITRLLHDLKEQYHDITR